MLASESAHADATIDGDLVTSYGLDAARRGHLNGMRVLIGSNHDEYQLFEPNGPLTHDPGIAASAPRVLNILDGRVSDRRN